MRMHAVIRLGSTIDRVWRQRSAHAGQIHGVQFRKRGRLYETDELDRDQVEAIRGHDSVELQGAAVLPDVPSLPMDGDQVDPDLDEAPKAKRKKG